MAEVVETTRTRRLLSLWPWATLALAFAIAVWHAVDVPDDLDVEFPTVARPTFSLGAPAAYRLAEPGDTLDRVALYASAAAIVLAIAGWSRRRAAGVSADLWPAATALALAAFWHSATPGPLTDGWHGIGWTVMANPTAPTPLKLALAAAFLALGSSLVVVLARTRPSWRAMMAAGRAKGILGLLVFALIGVGLRPLDIPGVELAGYWPRCSFALGLLAFDFAMLRALPAARRRPRPWLQTSLAAGSWAALVLFGLTVVWYQRPLARLKVVAPGKIYISAMPTYRGLQVAQGRHKFKTIINLYPEDTPGLRSPFLAEEEQFARERGIRYLRSPYVAAQSNAFLDQTLALAQDPAAWPILVHCHACMDRTPAWAGIYRFLVEGRPLLDVMREIERHRGLRPKASVTLLYNRVLPPRAPERWALDPTAKRLVEGAGGTRDPYYDLLEAEKRAANRADVPRVSRRDGPSGEVRRP